MGAKHLRRICAKAQHIFHYAIHSAGMYSYSPWCQSEGITITVSFLHTPLHIMYTPINEFYGTSNFIVKESA